MAQMTERSRAIKINGTLMVIGLLFNMGALLLLWVDAVRTPYIESDFSYSADVLTRKADYDAQTGRFLDTQYATARFQLDSTNSQNELKRSYTEEKTQPTSSVRPIDAKTGRYTDKHVSGNEYVLAPKDVSATDQFYFTPIEGGNPVLLGYERSELLQDLVVYRFTGTRQAKPATTAELKADESLVSTATYEVWIEPTSGWLVKYKSTNESNIVKTDAPNEIVSPFRQVSYVTTPQSVDQHTAYASTLRSKRLFILQVGPSLFAVAAIVFIAGVALVRSSRTRTIPLAVGITAALILSGVTLIGWLAGVPQLATFFVGGVAVSPLTLLCFIILIGGVFAHWRGKPRITMVAGTVVGVVATMQLLGSLDIIPFRLDTVAFGSSVPNSDLIISSMMSPYVSLALLIFSSIFIISGIRRLLTLNYLQFVVALTIMLGLLGVLLNVSRINAAIAIPFAWSLSLPESLLLIVAALTALQLFYRSWGLSEDIKHGLSSLRWASLASVPIVIIGIFAQMQQYGVSRDLSAAFDSRIDGINSALESRFQLYAQALYGARGLLLSSQEVTDEEWRDYNHAYRVNDQLIGMDAIGYATVENDQARVRHADPLNQDIPDNPYSNVVLRETVKRAIAGGEVQVSNSIAGSTPGDIRVYVVVPVYGKNTSIETVSDRQKNIEGFVFGAMSFPKVVHSATDTLAKNVNFEIYSGNEIDSEPLFRRYDVPATEVPRLTKQQSLATAGQAWTLVYHARPSLRLSAIEEYSASVILLGGSITYWGFLAVVYILTDMNRFRRQTRINKPTLDR